MGKNQWTWPQLGAFVADVLWRGQSRLRRAESSVLGIVLPLLVVLNAILDWFCVPAIILSPRLAIAIGIGAPMGVVAWLFGERAFTAHLERQPKLAIRSGADAPFVDWDETHESGTLTGTRHYGFGVHNTSTSVVTGIEAKLERIVWTDTGAAADFDQPLWLRGSGPKTQFDLRGDERRIVNCIVEDLDPHLDERFHVATTRPRREAITLEPGNARLLIGVYANNAPTQRWWLTATLQRRVSKPSTLLIAPSDAAGVSSSSGQAPSLAGQ